MKFDRKTLASPTLVLALAFALSACGGGAEEADDPVSGDTPMAAETEAAPADMASEEASAQPMAAATPSEEPSETPSPTPTPTASKAATPTPAAAAAPADPPQAFVQCSVCHSTKPDDNGIGPSLAGIYGTKAAEVPGFKFSPAMKESGLTWDEATLDTYLKDPRKVVPGTIMGFGGVKDDAKRKAIIEYLKTL